MPEQLENLAEWQRGLLDDAHDRAYALLGWAEEADAAPGYALKVAATALGLFAVLVFESLEEMPPERVDAVLRDELGGFVLTARKTICARMGDRVTREFHRETSRLDREFKRRTDHPAAEPEAET